MDFRSFSATLCCKSKLKLVEKRSDTCKHDGDFQHILLSIVLLSEKEKRQGRERRGGKERNRNKARRGRGTRRGEEVRKGEREEGTR